MLRKSAYIFFFWIIPLKKCKKKGENASPASVHAFSKTTVITWLDADNGGDDFSVGIGGPTPEPWLVMEASSASSSSIGELVKEEAVWILSEWQQVQRAIVQLTAVTNSIRNQLSEKCTYIQCVLTKTQTVGPVQSGFC